MLSYEELFTGFRKGIRNGNWKMLRFLEKALELLNKSEERGVFTWAPQLKYWLKDQDYIFWLGAGGLRIAI